MFIALTPSRNDFAADLTAKVPASAPGVIALTQELAEVWQLAGKHLRVRDNDAHTLYATAIASALLASLPEADADVVLPAILLHDIGWSQVDEDAVLAAIAPGGGNRETVRQHEILGARLAGQILTELGFPEERICAVQEIIDGHDSRAEALHLNDAIVKDADKLWRISPHGIETVMNWFGLDRARALRLCATRVHGNLFTEPARTLALGLSALDSVNHWPQRLELGDVVVSQ